VARIVVLPPDVQGQIAAGEVIERPASVVKELAENALDARARQIEVQLASGGLGRIVVRDDGEGIAADDVPVAFARHATSKLARADDLAAVPTLGFRGEALPSIAAIARVRLTSRRPDADAAVAAEADGDGARAAGPIGAPRGTTVEVHDLFAVTPARRKFLRAPATEVGHVVDVLTRLAVANPTVGFRLEHDGREVLSLPAVREPRQRLVQTLGRERATRLLAVRAAADGYVVHGFVAPPADALRSARLLWTYVAIGERGAARWIRDRLLLRAVVDGYDALLERGRYPIAMLFLEVPTGDVDVNVHPAKLEVRFRRAAAIHQLVAPALRTALAAALAPAGAPAASPRASALAEAAPAYGPPPTLPLGRDTGASQAGLWAPAPRGFASLRFIGQIFDGYLLCEGDGRIVLIDQHAAHERVVFERLRAEQDAGRIARDPLLVPETIELDATEAALLGEHAAALETAGLEGEPFGERTFLLRSVPRLLRGRDAGALVRAVATELAEEGASAAAARATHAVLATIACHSVVRVGQRLASEEVRALLASMDGVPVAAHCPHGRPVAAELTRSQLEALFHR